MKAKLTLLMVSAALLLGIFSCGGGAATEAEKPALNITPAQLAVKKDPVCGMNMENLKITDTAIYNGGTYAFCSDECKQTFKKEPTKYAVKK